MGSQRVGHHRVPLTLTKAHQENKVGTPALTLVAMVMIFPNLEWIEAQEALHKTHDPRTPGSLRQWSVCLGILIQARQVLLLFVPLSPHLHVFATQNQSFGFCYGGFITQSFPMAPAVKKPAEHQVRLGPPSGSDGTGSACSWEAPLQKGMATKSMGRAAGWPTVSRLPKSWTQPKCLSPWKWLKSERSDSFQRKTITVSESFSLN